MIGAGLCASIILVKDRVSLKVYYLLRDGKQQFKQRPPRADIRHDEGQGLPHGRVD